MDTTLIKEALESSLTLLNDELESVIFDELKEEYKSVIAKIETSLQLIDQER